jgi:hypothetical protein
VQALRTRFVKRAGRIMQFVAAMDPNADVMPVVAIAAKSGKYLQNTAAGVKVDAGE